MSFSIADQITSIKNELAGFGAELIAVSKTKPMSMIEEGYAAGHRAFGENKVQELVEKYEALPKDIEWHMIGHLQRNKVKYIAPFVHLIHGVDSIRLLEAINKEGVKNDRVIDCLLQVHIADESTKFGFSEDELREYLSSDSLRGLTHVNIKGLMGMATNTDNLTQVTGEFESLKSLFDILKTLELPSQVNLDILSMGMSGDYKLAIEAGSTMVRIGSTIFGARNYA